MSDGEFQTQKHIYCIIREEKVSEYVYVEAENEEKAKEIAEDIDSEKWRSNQNYEYEIIETSVVNDEKELNGRYIETKSGSYRFDKSNEI